MPPNQALYLSSATDELSRGLSNAELEGDRRVRCALLGTGMMGQEHCSYLMGYPFDARIDFLCDPHEPSLDACLKVMEEFKSPDLKLHRPTILLDEDELIKRVDEIDLLVIASPNYLHTDQILRWGQHDITILVEKPVAVSYEQHRRLLEFSHCSDCRARIWVAMEYRFIPAISKMLSLLPTIGDIKMVTIRENRYPFLHKIGGWNRDRNKTGDSLVEKCCHFFDLFRLITGKEASLSQVRALAQRGVNYEDEPAMYDVPIIDSAYVLIPLHPGKEEEKTKANVMGCLELCMYAEGSRHQEEIIVTGTRGRLEAYLPENKVYSFARPSTELWSDRTVPPPTNSIRHEVYDCSSVKEVFGIEQEIPTHSGYHYSSTAVEWHELLHAVRHYESSGVWKPSVSLLDGLRAVEIGLCATEAIVNEHMETK